MTFAWPPGAYTKTRVKIAQILWTLWLDFDGEITNSSDAVKELLDALRGHGVDIPDSDVMGYRIILPHLDGGKYGTYVQRLVIGQRTKSIKLASDLPDESHLPDGAGGVSVDDQIDRQLFGGTVTSQPARGEPTRDSQVAFSVPVTSWPNPASGNTGDDQLSRESSASGESGDENAVHPASGQIDDEKVARGETRDLRSLPSDPAQGNTCDSNGPARGDARDEDYDIIDPARGATRDARIGSTENGADDDIDVAIRRLDREAAGLFVPVAIDSEPQPRELLDAIVTLVADLEARLSADITSVEPPGRTEADWNGLLEEKGELVNRMSGLLRRAKGAEARLQERSAQVEGLEMQMRVLQGRYERLEANNRALMRGERAEGQFVRQAQRLLAETPSDRPEGGRNRRTTGSDSRLAYTAGPPD